MIRYSLICDEAHAFEGWFSSSGDFDRQVDLGLVSCPTCGSVAVSKSLMAPSVSTSRKKEDQQALATNAVQQAAYAKLKEAIAEIKAKSEDVGARFPEEARKIHYGEAEARGIIGQAKAEDVRSLLEEGIEVAPLPVLPDDVN